MKFSMTSGAIEKCAPLRGENTYEVLKNLGYTNEKIEELVKKGVVNGVSPEYLTSMAKEN